LTAAEVENARQQDRTIVWTWCLRGTLHLVTAQDARWLLPLLGPSFIPAGRRRMRQLGWDDEKTATGLRILEQA
jgi:hypothetical protein